MIRVYTQKYIPGKAEEERVDDVPQFAIGRAENNFSYIRKCWKQQNMTEQRKITFASARKIILIFSDLAWTLLQNKSGYGITKEKQEKKV